MGEEGGDGKKVCALQTVIEFVFISVFIKIKWK